MTMQDAAHDEDAIIKAHYLTATGPWNRAQRRQRYQLHLAGKLHTRPDLMSPEEKQQWREIARNELTRRRVEATTAHHAQKVDA